MILRLNRTWKNGIKLITIRSEGAMKKEKVLETIDRMLSSLMQIAAFFELVRGHYAEALTILLLLVSILMIDMISHLKMIRKIKTLNYREKHFDY